MLFSRNRKTCAPAVYDLKHRQREGLWALAERLLAAPSSAALRFNIMPDYSDRAGSERNLLVLSYNVLRYVDIA